MTTLTDQRQLRNVVKKSPSATDNGIVRYDGTTGDIIQNSNATIDDNGFVIAPGVKFVEGTTPATPPSGQVVVYTKADHQLYSLDSTGAEKPVGSSAIYPVSGITLAPAAFVDIVHNMNLPITVLKILIRQSTTYLSDAQKLAKFTIVEQVANTTIRITNISGISQSFDTLVLGFKYQVTPADLDADFEISYILGAKTNEPTGVENRAQLGIAFVDGTQTFTVTPSVATNVWASGVKYVKSTPASIAIPTPATSGRYFFLYNPSGVLTVNAVDIPWSLITDIPLGLVYWNATTAKGILYEERHGISMDGTTHNYLHNVFGTQYISGLSASGFVLNGNVTGDVTIAISNGTIFDEDLPTTITGFSTDPASFPVYSRTGTAGDWVWTTPQTLYFLNAGRAAINTFNSPVANGTWQQTQVTNTNFLNAWIVAVNENSRGDGTGPFKVIAIQGQAQYTSLALAQAATFNTEIQAGELPTIEFVPLYRITLETNNGYNAANGLSRVQSVTDIRRVSTPAGAATGSGDHNSLSGRSAASAHPASSIDTLTTAFNSMLSAADTTVQLALDTIDNNAVIKAASSTDRAIAIFNGITGQTIQNSLSTIDILGYIHTPALDFIESASAPSTPSSGLLSFYTKNDSRTYTKDASSVEDIIAITGDMPQNFLALWSNCRHDITAATWQQTRTGFSDGVTVRDPVRWAYKFGTTAIQVETTTPLRGTKSYFIANASNNIIETPCFNIALGDSVTNTLIHFRFDFSDTSFNNSPIIKLIKYNGTTYSSNVSATNSLLVGNTFTGYFQLPGGWSNTDNYSLCLVIGATTGNTYIDNMYIGTYAYCAINTLTNVNNFNGFLTPSLVTVQQTLDYIDDNAVIKSASATNKAIVRFSGTSGQDIQNSLATISDLGYVGTSALALSAITTPATPASGLLIYAKADNLVYKLDSLGSEVPIGSGSGGGSVKVTSYDSTSTILPVGASVTTDGRVGVNGDLVLFSNLSSGNNRVYLLGGVGTSITWTLQSLMFNNAAAPTNGDSVRIQFGTLYSQQLATFNGTNFFINDVVRYFDGPTNTKYWEQGSLKTLTLSNNVSLQPVFTLIPIGNENVVVDFSVLRSSSKLMGKIYITQNGTDVASTVTSINLGDTGITFDTDMLGSWNVNTPSSGVITDLYSVSFPNSITGWAVGSANVILKTIDSGSTWTSQTFGPTYQLKGVFFTDISNGWSCGDGGNIIATSNGGTGWASQKSGGSDLVAITMIDSTHGWSCGQSGNVYKTINGSTWTASGSGYSDYLFGLHAYSQTVVWAVGATGRILKTTDGGNVWTPQTQPGAPQYLYGVFFIDANIGWIVGQNGIIIKTVDGGSNWIAQTSGTSDTLSSVHFIDANRGIAVGGTYLSTCVILTTVDGGTTWTPVSDGTSALNSIRFIDASTAIGVGFGGTIKKLTTSAALRLLYSATNTGSTSTMKYSIKHWSDS